MGVSFASICHVEHGYTFLHSPNVLHFPKKSKISRMAEVEVARMAAATTLKRMRT